MAARYETLGVVMKVVGNNAGYTGAQMEDFAQGLEKSGISMTEARQSITRMVQAQLDLNQSSKLARVAQDAAVIGNINSSESFQRLVYGIQSGQVEMLRTIGINVNFENSYQKVAASTGRVVSSFTEAEKANIRMSAAMDAGEKISGTYEAAMGTAGKQVLSLTRHLENLQVLFGKAFTPALAEIIETITGAVTGLNGELSGDGKQKVEDWGNNFRLTVINIEAEIMRLGMVLDKIGGGLTTVGMVATGWGSALNIKSVKGVFESLAQSNIDLEKRYNSTGKELEKLAERYIKLEAAMSPAGKAQKQTAQDILGTGEAAETTGASIEKIAKAYGELISITSKYGEARLKIAATDFAGNLKTEHATIAQLKAGLESYWTTLQAVYTARIEGEKAIAEAMKNSGGKPGEAMKAQVEALKQEEKYNTDRLAGQQKYYDTLQALHAKATDAMKKKAEELKAIEDAAAKQRASHAAQMLDLSTKLMQAQGKAASDESIYNMKLKAVEAERADANKLSGDAQIAALQAVKDKYAALTGAVTSDSKVFDIVAMKWTEGLRTVQTEEESIRKAMENVASVQRDITKATEAAAAAKKAEQEAQKSWISDLEKAMTAAKAQMDEYKTKIDELSQAIAAMEREISISVIDKASGPIEAIKAKLDQLQDKSINVSVNKNEVVTKIDYGPMKPTVDQSGIFGGTPGSGVWNFGGVGGAGDAGINDHSGGYGGGTYSIPNGSGPPVSYYNAYNGTPTASNVGGGDVDAVYTYYDSSGVPTITNIPGYGGDGGYGGGDGGGGGEYARGAAFFRGNVIPFARGGVFNRPTLFPMSKGMGLMGEDGPEAVMPLTRGRDGKLGVKAAGGGSPVVHFAAGSVVINGVNKSNEEILREIVRRIPAEMRRQLKSVGA